MREWLEIALLESIKKIGVERKYFKQVKVPGLSSFHFAFVYQTWDFATIPGL